MNYLILKIYVAWKDTKRTWQQLHGKSRETMIMHGHLQFTLAYTSTRMEMHGVLVLCVSVCVIELKSLKHRFLTNPTVRKNDKREIIFSFEQNVMVSSEWLVNILREKKKKKKKRQVMKYGQHFQQMQKTKYKILKKIKINR